jgi:hypothetical protein
VVDGLRPVSENDVVAAFAITVPLRRTVYPATPVSSVEGSRDRSISLGPEAVALRPAGWEGGAVSDVVLTVAEIDICSPSVEKLPKPALGPRL